MELLRFTVRNQRLSGGKVRLVSDTIDYAEASFDFRTDDWSGLSKWAHFSKGDVVYDVNLVDDKITKDMHLNLDVGTWEVKLHGTDSEGTTRVTTDTAFIIVESYGNGEDENPLPEIPLSAAEQIDAKSQLAIETAEEAISTAEEAVEIAKEIQRAAANGEFNGKDGEPGKTPEIQIGNVETLAPEEQATVSIGGTTEKPIFNFGIPQGISGKDGIGIEDIEADMSLKDGGYSYFTVKLTDGREYGWIVKNGETGEKGNSGSPGLVWKGEWDEEVSYTAIKDGQISRDVVFYNGSAYVVAINNTAPVKGVVPEGDTSGSWALLAKKGDTVGDTENISERLEEVEEELENINPFKVSSFTASPNALEFGNSVSEVVLSWVLNKEAASVAIDEEEIEAVQSGSHTVLEEITATADPAYKSFELSATSENGKTASKTAKINFYNGIYYGAAPEDFEDFSVLTKVLSNARERTFEVTAEEGENILYILPTRLGKCTFKVGGFEGGFNLVGSFDFENDYGYTELYYLYVSAQTGLGETTVEVS